MEMGFDHVQYQEGFPGAYGVLLGVNAHYWLRASRTIIVDECDFPIVELYQWLKPWIAAGAQTDFAYTSIEAEEKGLVTFCQLSGGKVAVGSAWAGGFQNVVVSRRTVITACEEFLQSVDSLIIGHYGRDVQSLIGDLR